MKLLLTKKFNHIKVLWLSLFVLNAVLNFKSLSWNGLWAFLAGAAWWSIYSTANWFKYSGKVMDEEDL